MEKFMTVTGIAAPLLIPNIDTDVIIRIERLSTLDRDQLGPWAFEALRYRPDGSENPDFVLNRAPFRDARILIAAENFGCGSSREMAVWALMGTGIRCVIAPSFGDIFYGNCFQSGMLPIRLPASTVERLGAALLQRPEAAQLTVDLAQQRIVTATGEHIVFVLEQRRRDALLNGLDEIGLTLARDAQIAAFQNVDRQKSPWLYEEVISTTP